LSRVCVDDRLDWKSSTVSASSLFMRARLRFRARSCAG
jgi:hypothetical protein